VETVRYPGLASFPQKALADRQHAGGVHGGMLWFEVRGGTAAGRKLMDSVQRPWSLCENLGATESIITCPAVMTHANMLQVRGWWNHVSLCGARRRSVSVCIVV
jgi:cystathionine beta-lyase/cystathionine gamma-synthase